MTKRGPTLRNAAPKVDHLKPAKFKGYLTLGELARRVGKDKDWIRRLERADRLPKARRHKVGAIEVRLYSPARVREIEEIFSQMRRGRPRKGG